MNSKDWKAKLAKQRTKEIERQKKIKASIGEKEYVHPQHNEYLKKRNQDDEY